MSESNSAYYRRRASEERERAKQAELADAAAVHEELAKKYEALAEHRGTATKRSA
jgi:hypothetical protein